MTSNTRRIIMAAIGAYLIYSGVTLVRDTMTGKPENETLFIIVGVFFAVFGFATIVFNLRAFVKETKADLALMNAEETEEAEELTEEEAVGKENESSEKKAVDIQLDHTEAEPEKPEKEKARESEADVKELKVEEKEEAPETEEIKADEKKTDEDVKTESDSKDEAEIADDEEVDK